MVDQIRQKLIDWFKGYTCGADISVQREILAGDCVKAAYARGQLDASRHHEEKLKELGIL